jgi:DNA-binding IclR family transcriptional regulator
MEQGSDRSERSAKGESGQIHLALDLLEYLATAGQPRGLTEIATQIQGPKATIHRLLATLRARGYVSQDANTMAYAIGIRCFELGSLWARNFDLRSLAANQMLKLNERTGEIVHLAVYDGGDAVYVEKIESSYDVVPKSHVGARCPAPQVATGRVLLAHQATDELRAQLAMPLRAYTRESITDSAELSRLLEDVRQNGYAVNHSSYRAGVAGIAAPVRDHTGAVVAAVGLCLPEHRFSSERFLELKDATVQAAAGVSAEVGGLVGQLSATHAS